MCYRNQWILPKSSGSWVEGSTRWILLSPSERTVLWYCLLKNTFLNNIPETVSTVLSKMSREGNNLSLNVSLSCFLLRCLLGALFCPWTSVCVGFNIWIYFSLEAPFIFWSVAQVRKQSVCMQEQPDYSPCLWRAVWQVRSTGFLSDADSWWGDSNRKHFH